VRALGNTRTRRGILCLAGAIWALLLLASLAGPTASLARFTSTGSVPGNTFTAAASWVSFRSATSAGVSSGNLTISKPAGTVSGDFMIASIAVRPHTATITAPGGWTLVRLIVNSNDPVGEAHAVYRLLTGGSEPSSYTWTISANTGAVGGILTFTGVNTSTPINVENGQNTANGLTHATPSVTTTVATTMLVTSHSFTSAATWTPPGGMTEAVDVASIAVPQTTGISLEIDYVIQASAGATGTKTATASNDPDVGNTDIVALRQ
jgi:MSHA biogenesis protein MshQ